MSYQTSRSVPPDNDADDACALVVRCSYCGYEISEHEHTSPCPHCEEFAFPVESER